MKKRILTLLSLPLLSALLLVACEKEMEQGKLTINYNLNATIEALDGDPLDNAKVRLVNEEWIYWEIGDSISLGSNTSGSTTYTGQLFLSGGDDFVGFNGAFLAALPEGSKYFLGLHPQSNNNVIVSAGPSSREFTTIQVDLPAEQPLRNDITFAQQVFPMVAWYGGEWDEQHPVAFNLDFHSLAGITRLQLFNTGAAKTIDYITVTSLDSKQLKGLFTVNNYKTSNPSLTAAANTAANRTLTLTCGDEGLVLGASSLCSFYLVLPALGGSEVTTHYKLRFEIHATDGSVCTKTIGTGSNPGVPIRRNGITYLNAIDVKDWSSAGATMGLVGNGTQERPFKVYTLDDLVYLRTCYNAPGLERKINNQTITPNTWIRIMRSDIVLDNSWDASIKNFVGHMVYMAAPNSGSPGITNNSSYPLFEDIGALGVVEGLDMKANVSITSEDAIDYTPFCRTNRGTIRNCDVTNQTSESQIYNFRKSVAGICLQNYGTIEGCNTSARFRTAFGSVGGICLTNYSGGIIKGCQVSSEMTVVESPNGVGGICYQNNSGGTVKDCYFAATITGSTVNWGGIVYTNGGTVEHCSNTGSITTTLTNIGGIVYTNNGTLNYCFAEARLNGAQLGSIACNMTGGRMVNCYLNSPATAQVMLNTANDNNSAGGLIASLSGGTVANCYAKYPHIQRNNNRGIIGGFVGKATGGTLENCYVYEQSSNQPTFYGTSSGATYTHCYVVGAAADQGDVAHIAESAAEASAGTSGALIDLLNGDLPSGSPAATAWEADALDNCPILGAYSATKRRK